MQGLDAGTARWLLIDSDAAFCRVRRDYQGRFSHVLSMRWARGGNRREVDLVCDPSSVVALMACPVGDEGAMGAMAGLLGRLGMIPDDATHVAVANAHGRDLRRLCQRPVLSCDPDDGPMVASTWGHGALTVEAPDGSLSDRQWEFLSRGSALGLWEDEGAAAARDVVGPGPLDPVTASVLTYGEFPWPRTDGHGRVGDIARSAWPMLRVDGACPDALRALGGLSACCDVWRAVLGRVTLAPRCDRGPKYLADLQQVGRRLGIEAAVRAVASGVAVEDVVAGL